MSEKITIPPEVLKEMGDDMLGGPEQAEFERRVAEAVAREKAKNNQNGSSGQRGE